MLKQTVKTAVVIATSAIAIPYAVAIMCNMLHGWPQRRDKYRHALHPKKVYALNYVVLQQLAKIRYLGLMIQWKYFYSTAPAERIIKDMPYGGHDNRLDVYLPLDESETQVPGTKPVVVFVYGGSWGSGDKNMYGLLCAQLADKLKAVVVCPNYSTYPKGYVDDMVQDIVDCLSWIQRNVQQFGGDKDRVILTGHSAGGHLAVLSVLELTMKRLLHQPETLLPGLRASMGPPGLAVSRQSSIFSDSIRFEDRHFNGSNNDNTNGDSNLSSIKTTTGSFYMVRESDRAEDDDGTVKKSDDEEVTQVEKDDNKEQGQDEDAKRDAATGTRTGVLGGGDFVVSEDQQKQADDLEVLTVEVTEEMGQGDAGMDEAQISERQQEDDDNQLSETQREAHDLLSSIRLVIGLAGVYHIADHYDHEASRGIEDISTMAKAMYAQEHFDRLSPEVIIQELPDKIKLPPVLLIHGDKDLTVPLLSSVNLARTMMDKGHVDVSLSVIPGCSHTDVCLDLMDPHRAWYDPVMGEIMGAVNKCL